MRALVLLALSCVPVVEPYAGPPEPALVLNSEPVPLGGPKAVTVLGADAPLIVQFAAELEQRGFSVSRAIPDVTSPLRTLYVVHIGGVCDLRQPTLHAEVFETRTNQSLFRAEARNPAGCPGTFVRELAELLEAQWAKPKQQKAVDL